MSRFQCEICGWIYDEKTGHPEGGVSPGTRFRDLPESWHCPFCAAGREKFRLLTSTDQDT